MKKTIFFIFIICLVVLGCASKETITRIEEPVIAKPSASMIRLQGTTIITQQKPGNGPPNEIVIKPFYLGVYLVTQKEYQEIMGTNPSFFKGENLPVENVSWKDSIEFCNRLSRRDRLTPVYEINNNVITWNHNANGYRLPTELEWEYACRAGTTTPFSTGNHISTNQANYDGRFPYNSNTRGEYRARTTPVGSFAANPWGLYDMHGNVWEWCWDDPAGSHPNGASEISARTTRVIRGGAWSSSGISLLTVYRSSFQPHWSNNYIGFRLARNAD